MWSDKVPFPRGLSRTIVTFCLAVCTTGTLLCLSDAEFGIKEVVLLVAVVLLRNVPRTCRCISGTDLLNCSFVSICSYVHILHLYVLYDCTAL